MAPWEAELAASELAPVTRYGWERERRRRSRGDRSGLRLGDGWRRESGDVELLEFLSRFTVITVRQAARFFYGGQWNTARKRVGKMADAGLIERDQSMVWAGTVVWPTVAGQQAVLGRDHPLSTPVRPKESQMLHRLLVTEQAAALVGAGRQVFSERELFMFENRGAHELGDWLTERGVVVGDGVGPGVVPTVYDEPLGDSGAMARRERWLACATMPAGMHRRVMRYPDLVEVTDAGELRAIEVELVDKTSGKLRQYVDGYRDAGPHVVEVDGRRQIRHRQFRYVRWLCSPSVQRHLIGYPRGVHPVTGSPALGAIRESYNAQSNPYIGDTSSVYWKSVRSASTGQVSQRLAEFDASGVAEGRPMSAEPIPIPDDDGIAWRVTQQFIPDRMYCALSEWGRWSRLWRTDLSETGHTELQVPFHRWIALGDNHQRCLSLTR